VDGKPVGSAQGSGGSQLVREQAEFDRQAEPTPAIQALACYLKMATAE
jgi:hypothetical protein